MLLIPQEYSVRSVRSWFPLRAVAERGVGNNRYINTNYSVHVHIVIVYSCGTSCGDSGALKSNYIIN